MTHDEYSFWWDCPLEEDLAKSKVHESLFDHVRAVEERQHAIHRLNLFNAKLYTNRRLACLTWGTHSEEEGSYGPENLRKENIIASGVDTATALIGRQRPKPTPVPKDADFSVERLARTLDQWLYHEFKTQKVYAKMQKAFNDCCWASIGALFIGVDNDEIYTERVMPDEIVVDQRECTSDNEPIQVHRRRLMSKVVLRAMYPEAAIKIDASGSKSYTSYRTPGHDMLVVVESWKLALPGEKAGRHSVVIEGCTLLDERYERDCFPFVFLRWGELPTGFYAKSLVEEGAPFQLRHNELNQVIQQAQDLMCVPRIFVDASSRLIKSQLDNEIARIIQYRGKPPTPMTWPAMPPEMYVQREENKAAFFEAIGFSRMSAQAKVPDGVRFDSSKALRQAHFRENERFSRQSSMLEDSYMAVAEHYIYHALQLYKGRKAETDWEKRTLLDEVDWDTLGAPGTKYSLQLEATSLQDMTPAAREDQLNTWANNGILTPDEYKGLLSHPDLEEETSLFQVSMDNIKSTIEQLDKGEFPQPEPLQNLTLGIPYIHKVFLKRQYQKGVPETTLQNYRDWLVEAQALLEGQQPDQMMPDPLAAPVGPDGTPLPAVAVTEQGLPTIQ